MRPHKRLSLVELMVIMAVVGILAAIVLPAAKQAKERAQAPRAPAAPQAPRSPAPQAAIEPAGQLNTIEVSEYAADSPEEGPDQWERLIAPFVPLAFMAVVAFVVVTAMRRQMSRRVGQ